MSDNNRLAIQLERVAYFVNLSLPMLTAIIFILFFKTSNKAYLFLTLIVGFLFLFNLYLTKIQRKHALLRNFGLLAYLRYLLESVGPEFRQYLYSSDIEEKPFNRIERSEVYQKSKGVDSTSSFGSQELYHKNDVKIRHSFYPMKKKNIDAFSLKFGEANNVQKLYSLKKPIMISAMSYGSLGIHAVRALSRGAKLAGIPINTGEGGYPKYHLMEGGDTIFQIGTAKFGVRNDDSSMNFELLKKLASEDNVKMIELKLSQGAKPGKGGILPKEKISQEISELRGVPRGKDVISPPYHVECIDAEKTIDFIGQIKKVIDKPLGIKFCLGRVDEFKALVREMKNQDIYPDYIAIDGAEGGTGAAPKSFMDDVGMSIRHSLPLVHKHLIKENIRDRIHLLASGKLISPGKQILALALGADAIYSARGFMLAIGCIQALQCNKNTCPVGITTHDLSLQNGLDIEVKAQRVANYVKNLDKELYEILAATGCKSFYDLNESHLYQNLVN